jgi:hypothetical protein
MASVLVGLLAIVGVPPAAGTRHMLKEIFSVLLSTNAAEGLGALGVTPTRAVFVEESAGAMRTRRAVARNSAW